VPIDGQLECPGERDSSQQAVDAWHLDKTKLQEAQPSRSAGSARCGADKPTFHWPPVAATLYQLAGRFNNPSCFCRSTMQRSGTAQDEDVRWASQ